MPICCLACWCFPCVVSRNSVDLDGAKRNCCNVWCCCCYPASIRKNRSQALATFGIRESCCTTCCITWCCSVFSECQVAREIKSHQGVSSQVVVANNGIRYRGDAPSERIEMKET